MLQYSSQCIEVRENHLELVDFIVDEVVHLWVKTSGETLLARELIECCGEKSISLQFD